MMSSENMRSAELHTIMTPQGKLSVSWNKATAVKLIVKLVNGGASCESLVRPESGDTFFHAAVKFCLLTGQWKFRY